MIEILGYIFLFIITAFAAWLGYHLIKAMILGADLMRWRMEGVTWAKIKSTPRWARALVSLYLECWFECFGYDGSTTYSRNGRTWEGYGTGRYNG